MTGKIVNWFKIADSKDEINWQQNNLAIAEVGGKTITLALIGDKLFACAAKCPHASGRLADGFIDALGNIVCPLHRYKFSMKNGRNTSGEDYHLKVYAIEERDTGIHVGFEDTSPLSRQ
jgi:3-phenylpropionate/trans-cinnamate dioxygenase ferredoxin subunit